MSLVAHPERNVLITGQVESPYIDVARMLGVRLSRRICDVQVETRRRKLLSLSGMLTPAKNDATVYADVLRECCARRNQVACLDYPSLAAVAGYEHLLPRFYVVTLLQADEEPEGETGDIAARNGPAGLPADLQLNCEGFQVRQLARIIAHCLYG